jgi:glycosyltransferase involved in cell wall biosynthesis
VPDATIVIVTRNRREELRRALVSATAQQGAVDVLVIDDGSTDGTSEMVAREFPLARLRRFNSRKGLVVRRNQGAAEVTAPVLISIDDDAVFTSPQTVAQTLADFDHPRVGAVAIPFVDVIGDRETASQRPPDREGRWIAPTFRGTAHAIRSDVFATLGGYREAIVHQGEESDFCLRMLAAGHVVRLGRADEIRHHNSPSRDLERMDVYGRRNELLLAFTYNRFPRAAVWMLAYAAKGLRLGFSLGRPVAMVRGIRLGLRDCWAARDQRSPLPSAILRLDRRLRRAGSLPLEEVEPLLAPVAESSS